MADKFIKIITNIDNDIDYIKATYNYTIIEKNNYKLIIDMSNYIKNFNTNDRLIIISDSNVHLISTINSNDYKLVYISTKDHIISKTTLDSLRIDNTYCSKNMLHVKEDDIINNDIIYEGIMRHPDKISKCVSNYIKNDNVHLIIDADFVQNINLLSIIKSLNKNQVKILEFININKKELKNNIRNIILALTDTIERKINIFNENSEILIYRPVEQDDEKDVGWYLLRGISDSTKMDIYNKLTNGITLKVQVDDELIMINKTTMEYQNNMTYYDEAVIVSDKVLFPSEKMDLCFELIN
jgi:hypothetical protein